MDDDSGFVRGGAAWVLGNIGDKRAIEPLKKALNDESSYVKRVAEKFLKKLEEYKINLLKFLSKNFYNSILYIKFLVSKLFKFS